MANVQGESSKALERVHEELCGIGCGSIAEGDVLFSVGNIMPLFKSLYPECWADHIVYDSETIKAIKHMEILGVGSPPPVDARY